MKSAKFNYEKPRALADAVNLLAAGGGMAKIALTVVIAKSPPGINFAKQSRGHCGLGGNATRLLCRVAPRNDMPWIAFSRMNVA